MVKFLNYECDLSLGHYANGRLAIRLVSAEDRAEDDLFIGQPIATATVNMPEIKLEDNQVIIKNEAENTGILQALQAAGFLAETIRTIPMGYSEAVIVSKGVLLLELEEIDKKNQLRKNKP